MKKKFKPANLAVIRHGEAEHNVKRVYNANPKLPNYFISNLTENGREVTLKTAQELIEKGFTVETVEAVYVSPLPRTQQTAQLLAESGVFCKSKIITDERLKETLKGKLEGQGLLNLWNDELALEHDAETDQEITDRIHAFCADLPEHEGRVLIVTHGVPALKLTTIISGSNQPRLSTGEAWIHP